MKKSQIILGGSAFILAIAGAFATKANRTILLSAAFTQGSASACTKMPAKLNQLTLQAINATALTAGGTRKLRTFHKIGTATICGKTYHKQPLD